MPIRLLALDIDDTIYEWPGEVSPANRRALQAAQEAGVVVCLATARHVASADDFTRGAGIRGPLIANSGATVRFDPDGETTTRAPMSREACRPLVDFADEREIVLWITLPDGRTLVRDDSSQTAEAAARHIIPVPTNAEALLDDPVRIIAIGAGGATICEEVMPLLGDQFSLNRTFRGGEFVGVAITDRRATKESALTELCDHLGISLAETLAMGDAEADIGMIRAAGVGIAPANAEESVRAAADVVAPACKDDGVAWVIERYCGV